MRLQEEKKEILDIRDLSVDEINKYLQETGQPSYHAAQTQQCLWKYAVATLDQMDNRSTDVRSSLAEDYSILPMPADIIQRSFARTVKCRCGLSDGLRIESVLIPVREDDRCPVC